MNTWAKLIVAAAALLVGAIGAYQFLPRGSGSGGPTSTPSSSPALLARGNFMTNGREVVGLDATADGSGVTGRMTVSAHGQNEPYAFTVDLQCARESEDGLIMIGGVTIASRGQEASQEGTWAGIVLERGSPVGASTWRPAGQVAGGSCLAFLDEQDRLERSTHPGPDGDWTDPIEGTVELGPLGFASGGATTAPSANPSLIARGRFVDRDLGLVEFEATRTGAGVTGRMTIKGRGAAFPHMVELQCARETEDGLIMIGGVSTDDGPLAGLSAGSLRWIAVRRGSPDRATVGGGSTNTPATQTTNCLAYLDAWMEEMSRVAEGIEWPWSVMTGTVEFGP